MVDWSQQRYYDDVNEGDEVPSLAFPLTVHRLIVQAGANKDFAQIHHNTEVAQAQGAQEIYANNVFTQGMWERVVREYIGLDGVIKKIGPFRMKLFNTVGETVIVKGHVRRKWQENGENFVELELRSEIAKGISVGPGPVLVTLPKRGA
jgi:hypothetical protein